MENTIYWLWLSLKQDLFDKDKTSLIKAFYDARSIYEIEDKNELSGYPDRVIDAVLDKSLDNANNVSNKIKEIGGYIVSLEDYDYPTLLKNIYDPPLVLYMLGERLPWDELLTITIVGTRTFDEYGEKVTRKIATDLSKAGAVIVSGMARGIDSISGESVIMAGGKTIAVLGSGLDVVYPPEHIALYRQIAKNGVVMTEYPPGTRPLPQNFPRRNRIMAGLSYGVVVTEAPLKSGALITASIAMENGRDVFSVPADIFSNYSAGTNKLINQGAKAVCSYRDILEEYPYFELIKDDEETSKTDSKKTVKLDGLTDIEQEIVKALAEKDMHIDELSRLLNIDTGRLSADLLMLELSGVVRKSNDNIIELL